MVNELLLLSGNDIPFTKARLTIHQPTMKEIAYIGEECFFIGCEMLNFSKDILSDEDKSNLIDKSNFEIFMSIMNDKRTSMVQKNRICARMVLSLIFPDYQITMNQKEMLFAKIIDNEVKEEGKITKDNFEEFKEILSQMFCLESKKDDTQDLRPVDRQSRRIAEKIQEGRQKVAGFRGEDKKIAIFSRYMSILVVGQFLTFEEVSKYTVYQIFDEFERFEMKNEYDIYLEAKLAGAKDLQEVDNWMKDIHS